LQLVQFQIIEIQAASLHQQLICYYLFPKRKAKPENAMEIRQKSKINLLVQKFQENQNSP